ncbi:MAG TPA: tetratricopeptide repeat protein [Legionella sp.]|nr:tetratricopeptide repeat protein [Legionella sp.]
MFEELFNQCLEQDKFAHLDKIIYHVWKSAEIEYAKKYFENKGDQEKNGAELTLLGYMHLKGYGVDQNYGLAIQYFEQAIEKNIPQAMVHRATMHLNGHGGARNYLEVHKLYNRAIGLGDQEAVTRLGTAYRFQREFKKAITCFEQAITAKSAKAMLERASMLLNGEGEPKDYGRAVSLLDQAYKLGNIQALVLRADLFASGRDEPRNADLAAEMYFKAYSLTTIMRPKVLDGLNRLVKDETNNLARAYLIMIYLRDGDEGKAKADELYSFNFNVLVPILYRQLSWLVDNLPHSKAYFEILKKFVEEKKNTYEPIEKIYFNFKLSLRDEKFIAFDLFENFLEHTDLLNSKELFEMGNMKEFPIDGLSPEQILQRKERACELYFAAYEKSQDQQYMTKLLHTLRSIESKEAKGIEIDINSPDEIARLNRFIDKYNKQKNTSVIQVIETFISVTSFMAQSLKAEFKKICQDSLDTANDILIKLKHGISLTDILGNRNILSQIHKNSSLFNELNRINEVNNNNPLDQILSVEECREILTQPNSGEKIYKALSANKIINREGLRILAKHKEQTLTYMRTLTNEVLEVKLREALDFTEKENTSPPLLHQFFAVQRGFFKTRQGHGSFLSLENLQENLNRVNNYV